MDPYTHLFFARLLFQNKGTTLPFILSGSVAPDAGYFAREEFSELIHKEPFRFFNILAENARTPAEKFFCIGWLTHVILDEVGHNLWTYEVMKKYTKNPEDEFIHRKVEWGLGKRIFKKFLNEDRVCLDFSLTEGIVYLVDETFSNVFGRVIPFHPQFERMKKKLTQTIPLTYKYSFIFRPSGKLLSAFGERKISAVINPITLSKSQEELAFKTLKVAEKRFRKTYHDVFQKMPE